MSDIEDALDQVIKEELEEAFIPCLNKRNQESVRVMTFNAKNKIPEAYRKEITISKVVEGENFFIKVYKSIEFICISYHISCILYI